MVLMGQGEVEVNRMPRRYMVEKKMVPKIKLKMEVIIAHTTRKPTSVTCVPI